MVSKTASVRETSPMGYAANPTPTVAEWEGLWALWDTVTLQMIPQEELLSKPIKLRNACIFYLGHIPTFLDMKLADTTDGSYTEPTYFPKIFERGIDPDVDNPEQCHAHSEIPDEWPALDVILMHQRNVRERVRKLYDLGAASDPHVGRTLWLGYEHEAMHLETLLYMLIQSEKTLPPPSASRPAFEDLAKQAKMQAVANEWFTVPETDLTVGMDDPENALGKPRYFGWDVEKPQRTVHVKSFQAKARPITIGEYAEYIQQTGDPKLPASWAEIPTTDTNTTTPDTTTFLQRTSVRTIYGPISLSLASDWPVCASYDELAGCARYMGGRIPTLDETRSIYNDVDLTRHSNSSSETLGKTIPAVNSHLVHNGVRESPPSTSDQATAAGSSDTGSGSVGPDPHKTFIDLSGANVGFRNWHPTPVTQNGGRLGGQADMGGVWEWTSSPLVQHEGYESMPLYPAYSCKFPPFPRWTSIFFSLCSYVFGEVLTGRARARNSGFFRRETQRRAWRVVGNRFADRGEENLVSFILHPSLISLRSPLIFNRYYVILN